MKLTALTGMNTRILQRIAVLLKLNLVIQNPVWIDPHMNCCKKPSNDNKSVLSGCLTLIILTFDIVY